MDFLTLAKKRFSCRKYTSKVPEDAILKEVLDAARVAPSAVNFQPWHFVVVRSEPLLEAIKSCYKREWIKSAPVVIVACGNHKESWKRDDGKDHCDIDLSIAIDHITLAATDKDLGTCWICKFDSKRAGEILALPAHWEAIAMIPIGYPDTAPDADRHQSLRKKLDDIVSFDEFVEHVNGNGRY